MLVKEFLNEGKVALAVTAVILDLVALQAIAVIQGSAVYQDTVDIVERADLVDSVDIVEAGFQAIVDFVAIQATPASVDFVD